MLTLKLRLDDVESSMDNSNTHETVILQKDTKLPKSRKNAHSYTINGVYDYKSSYVAIIGYQLPGFEGSDRRYIAVSWSRDY